MNEKYTLQDLIEALSDTTHTGKEENDTFVRAFFELIKEGLEKDKYVKIKGLGTFKVIDIEPRESINVNTGERFRIEGHQKISFTPDAGIKETINRPFASFETVILKDDVSFDSIDKEADTAADNEEGEAEIPDEDSEKVVAADTKEDETHKEETTDMPVARESEKTEERKEESPLPATETKEPEKEVKEVPETPPQAEQIIADELRKTSRPASMYKTVKSEKKIRKKKRRGVPPNITMGIILFFLLLACAAGIYWILTPEAPAVGHDYTTPASEKNAVADTGSINSFDTDSMIASEHENAGKDGDTLTYAEKALILATHKKDTDKAVSSSSHVGRTKKEVPARKATTDGTSEKHTGKITVTGLKTIHVMQKGENLYSIAKKYLGSKDKAKYLIEYNHFKNPDVVVIGTKIRIPELSE